MEELRVYITAMGKNTFVHLTYSQKKLEITDYCTVKEYKYLSFNLSPKVSVKDISKINEDVNVILDHQNGRKFSSN